VCAALVAVAQSGCVAQSHYRDGRLVSRTIGFGVARLPDCDPATSTVVVTSALGAGIGRSGLMLGAMQAERACIPLECKAVFWVENPSIVEEVRALIGDDEHMCVASGKGMEQ
jgi:hypothetical protein